MMVKNEITGDAQDTQFFIRKIEILFLSEPGDPGTIENPTKDGLIAIARLGRMAWNAWRHEYPLAEIDFSRIIFPGVEQIDFSGFDFSSISKQESNLSGPSFDGAFFPNRTKFDGAIFGDNASFIGAKFGHGCSFRGATIGKRSNFKSAEFHAVEFDNAEIRDFTSFIKSRFSTLCSFNESTLGNGVSFADANFDPDVDFIFVNFGPNIIFNGAEFRGRSSFHGSEFDGIANFKDTKFADLADFSNCHFKHDLVFSATKKDLTIGPVYFTGTSFDGNCIFDGREFKSSTDFGPGFSLPWKARTGAEVGPNRPACRFKLAPRFHGCELHQDTNFDHAVFLAPPSPEAARAYRTLKLAMEKLKATREEQRFFRLEMKAERPSVPLPRQVLSLLYEWCSDYGFSLWRPLVALLVFSLIFGGAHGLLANTCTEQPECAASAEPGDSNKRTFDLIKYVLANVAPVPGLDKMQTELRKPLFGEHGPIAVAAIILEILHKIVALVMTFLFALGLRNLFKMKS